VHFNSILVNFYFVLRPTYRTYIMLAFENQKNVWCPEMSEPGSGKLKFLAIRACSETSLILMEELLESESRSILVPLQKVKCRTLIAVDLDRLRSIPTPNANTHTIR
jgi:hypothetical protein